MSHLDPPDPATSATVPVAPDAAASDHAEPTFALLADDLTAAEESIVAASAAFLHAAALRHGVDHAVEVRDHILQTYFDGDFAAFADPSPTKPRSFRALCARADLPYQHGTLLALVRIGQQIDELPPGVGRGLSLSHHRALLPLGARLDDKAALAQLAVEQRLSAAELEERVRAAKPRSGVGRPPLPAVVKRSNAVQRAVARLEQPRAEEIAALDASKRAALAQELRDAVVRLQAWLTALGR